MKNSKGIVIAGGGTGGHVLAGIAIAEAWIQKCGKESSIDFVGSQGGMELKLVPAAGFRLHLLQIGSLNRVSIRKKLKTFFQLPLSFFKSMRILLKFKPGFVIGVGGYSSGPVVMMAWILKTLGLLKSRIGILEQNSMPGLTNRILSRFVDVAFVAFPGTDKYFPHLSKNQVILTGNPIRSSMTKMPSASRDPFKIFVFGGSQGAMGINTLVLAALPHLKHLGEKLQWVHQTGSKDYDRVREGYRKEGVAGRVEQFIYTMPSVYAESSLLICRAGSSTLAEVAAVGRAAIFIPLPTASDNHQEYNARVFVDAEAGFLLSQNLSKGKDLAELILKLHGKLDEIERVEKKVLGFSRPGAAGDLVEAFLSSC